MRPINLSTDLIGAIHGYKQSYLTAVGHTYRRDQCALLTCWCSGRFKMNSLHYCNKHTGLALINNMQHVCDACHTWNLLALKEKGGETAHVRHSVTHLHIPLRDHACGVEGIRIERFCSERFSSDSDTPAHHAPPGRIMQYRTHSGALRRVPDQAYVHVSRATGLVTGWIRVWEYCTRTGEYHLVTDEARFPELMDRVDGWRSTGWTRGVCQAAVTAGGGGW